MLLLRSVDQNIKLIASASLRVAVEPVHNLFESIVADNWPGRMERSFRHKLFSSLAAAPPVARVANAAAPLSVAIVCALAVFTLAFGPDAALGYTVRPPYATEGLSSIHRVSFEQQYRDNIASILILPHGCG